MRRRSAASSNPVTSLLSAVGLTSAVGLIAFAGLSYAGLLGPQQGPAQRSRVGMVKVPRSLKAIAALTKVTREDIHSLELGEDSYFWMEQARVDAHPEYIRNAADIIGRVMARNKLNGWVFTEKDFLPEGSRTGLSGGVPEAKQGFFVESTKIPGLELLKMGDTFDLLAGLPEEAQQQPEAEYGLLAGGVKVRGGKPIPVSGVRLLVQDAQMVAVTRGRDMTTQGVMDLPEPSSRNRTVAGATQITIAIDPQEVVPLTQALAAGRMIHCVARSGRNTSGDDANALRQKISGMVAFPATARVVKAYTRITADDLADPDTGELRMYYFLPDKVRKGWITSPTELIGRVVARDTSAGFIFSEEDFLPAAAVVTDVSAFHRIKADDLADPESASALIGRVVATDITPGSTIGESDLLPPGAAAGISGGTPPGRMAISVDRAKVQGVSRLRRGDQFDLLASIPYKPGDAFTVLGSTVQLSGGLVSQAELNDQARNELLAEGVIVVDVDETTATIAVRPSEVPGITKALTLGMSVFALARSSRSGDPSKSHPTTLKSDPNPIDRITVIEEIVGDKRKVRIFAADRNKGD